MRRKIIDKALAEFKAELGKIYGPRLSRLILYGSYARGNARADSDAVVEMNLNHQVLISIYPVSERDFRFRKSPLLMNIHKEGERI